MIPDPRAAPQPGEQLDPARWVALAIAVIAAFIVVLDNTVLNVSIPTILRDLHTTLPSLEWVITGYALTFAALLIIGGRLGDVYGHRRVFILGLALFGIGSLFASLSRSVGQLIVGEAIIEGVGASLMMPSTLAILSGTFKGRERATAFAAWGATAGVAAALGPVVGGWLTSDYSWRWSFRINVIIAPLAIVGAVLFMKDAPPPKRRIRIDLRGAFLVATGMFLLVFALSQGGVYGWWKPIRAVAVGGHGVWAATAPVSMIPLLLVISLLVLVTFVWLELRIQRRGGDPLFEFAHLRLKTYRYGLLTVAILAMGQLGLSFVLPIFLQDAKHLSAARNGLWLLPTGLFLIVGAQIGGLLIRHLGTTTVVRIGLGLYTVGILLILRVVSLHVTVWSLLPGFGFYGFGIGFAGAQLTNVILSEVPSEGAGGASGANSTVRQVGSALGVSVIGSLLTVQTVRSASSSIRHTSLSAAVKVQAVAGVRSGGSGYVPPGTLSTQDRLTITRAIEHGVITGTRLALTFVAVMIALGSLMALLIPNDGRRSRALPPADEDATGADWVGRTPAGVIEL